MLDTLSNGRPVYSFMGYTSAQKLGSYGPVFEQAIKGFGPVTDPRILQVQPGRLQVVRADRPGPFRSFIPQRLPPGLTGEDLAILNQVRLDESIPAGASLKLPRTDGVTRQPMISGR